MSTNIRHLINQLNTATKAYDEGNPIMSDKDWDAMYYELETLEKGTGIIYPDSPTQRIDYQVVNGLKKVTHEIPMLSLAKTKELDEVESFIGDNLSLLMLKLDGLTIAVTYEKGKLVKAETRGNGTVGEDVTHNARAFKNLPQSISYQGKLIVFGEALITDKDFAPFADEYKNSRNLASGSVRLLDSKESAKRNISFVAWRLVQMDNMSTSFNENLQELENMGFTVVPHLIHSSSLGLEYEINKLKELRDNYGHPIDGIVISYDDISLIDSLGATDHHLRGQLAFKFYDEEYETTLLNIDWTMGRSGRLTPVAIFKPVNIDGSIVERASMHNISIMHDIFLDNIPKVGDIISIFKSNMVIPQVKSVVKYNHEGQEINIPTTCPICGAPTEIREDNDSQMLYCTNKDCSGRLSNVIDHMFGIKGLDIRGISYATIEKLIDWGWVNSPSDMFKLKQYENEWAKKRGFGGISVHKMLQAIEDKCAHIELAQFIAGMGIPLIGRVEAKKIAKICTTWDDFRDKVRNNYNFASIPGFAESKMANILSFDYTEADEIAKLMTMTNELPFEKLESKKLDGITIAITGKLENFKSRAGLKKLIEDNGGKVSESITNKVSILINNNPDSHSAKNQIARRTNVPMMTEKDFLKKFDLM